MDKFIAEFPARTDRDLVICEADGVAYQADMKADRVDYGPDYFDKYLSYEGTPIALALNAGRVGMLEQYAQRGSKVLDIGAGCGTFVRESLKKGFDAYGFDINPKTVEFLKKSHAYSDIVEAFDVVTFWDSLEHIECPEDVLGRIRPGAVAIVAIPVFEDLRAIRMSKHYRPGEHLYYFSSQGFIQWMGKHGFRMIGKSTHEIEAGRESIGSFAFRKDLQTGIERHECGGPVYVDYYNSPKQPKVWFKRCGACWKVTRATCATEEEAKSLPFDDLIEGAA